MGSVGLGGSANVGEEYAMFEAIHGSAPDIAGKGIANPSGLLTAACMMLIHLRLPDICRVNNECLVYYDRKMEFTLEISAVCTATNW